MLFLIFTGFLYVLLIKKKSFIKTVIDFIEDYIIHFMMHLFYIINYLSFK